jgi:hypothetical protein
VGGFLTQVTKEDSKSVACTVPDALATETTVDVVLLDEAGQELLTAMCGAGPRSPERALPTWAAAPAKSRRAGPAAFTEPVRKGGPTRTGSREQPHTDPSPSPAGRATPGAPDSRR